MVKSKISFDFDGVLSREDFQDYFLSLKGDYDLYVVTARYPNSDILLNTNEELFNITDRLGVDRSNIVFLSYGLKSDYFKDKDEFLFHLDDSSIEVDFINSETNVKGIYTLGGNNWNKECKKLLDENIRP